MADLEGQLRGLMLQHISDGVAQSGIPFLDLAANQVEFAKALQAATAPAFEALGLELTGVTVQNVSLPELQRSSTSASAWASSARTWAPSCSTRRPSPSPSWPRAQARAAASPARPWAWARACLGQTLAQQLGQGLAGVGTAAQAAPVSKPDDIVAMLEKLGDLKAKGILTDEEFAAKKADLLKKLG